MTRLDGVLNATERRSLSLWLASQTIDATRDALMHPTIVTSDDDVTHWARSHGADVARDVPPGLSASVSAAVSALEGAPWLVVHADLPLVDADSLAGLGFEADEHRWSIAPSLDGGTNVIAGTGAMSFSYGPDSFHRHLALLPSAAIVVDRRLALELDTPSHMAVLSTLGFLPSLSA